MNWSSYRLRIASALATFATVLASCSIDDRTPIVIGNDVSDAAASFGEVPDSGPEATSDFISYCPSDTCPAGHTTCPGSYFPCDVNLRTDLNNCGTCGAACPVGTLGDTFACIEGRCVLNCSTWPVRLDCDGVPDNLCETYPRTNENCGGCGVECLDPEKPCVEQFMQKWGCGCVKGTTYCSRRCVYLNSDDNNCGACGKRCAGNSDGGPPPPNAHWGCGDGVCETLKCDSGYGNCDSDSDNGCETKLLTNENCGGCGTVCPQGTQCAVNDRQQAFCACPEGKTFCPSSCFDGICTGECFDLTSDPENCGACGLSCDEKKPTMEPTCAFGICAQHCTNGSADCNGNASDGCEINTLSDPRNCGGCGVTCDAIAGQACVLGRCAVEPCDQPIDAGGAAR